MQIATALVKFTLELAMLCIKGMAQLLGALLTLLFNGVSAWMASRSGARVQHAPKSPLARFAGRAPHRPHSANRKQRRHRGR